jgi:hypothetical protein
VFDDNQFWKSDDLFDLDDLLEDYDWEVNMCPFLSCNYYFDYNTIHQKTNKIL